MEDEPLLYKLGAQGEGESGNSASFKAAAVAISLCSEAWQLCNTHCTLAHTRYSRAPISILSHTAPG